MEDDTSEELTPDSESSGYTLDSDSFIDDLEEELTWDSEDSRPAGPSPDSDPWEGIVRERRNRPVRRRRVVLVLPDNSTESSPVSMLENAPRSQAARLRPVTTSQESDSDETYISGQSHSPEVMAPPSPNRTESPGNGLVPRSPDYSPPLSPRASVPQWTPRSPDYPPPPLAPTNEVETIEIPSSPTAQPADVTEHISAVVTNSKPAVGPEENQLDTSVLSEGEDNSLCTICMCPLTNSGTHRVVCLKCGHIFGQACVERWIKVGCNNGARRCPTCNKKASLKDIRVLYLPKVVPLDTSERDRLIQEKEELAAQKKMLESDFSRSLLQHQLVVADYKKRIEALEKQLKDGPLSGSAITSLSQVTDMVIVTTVNISYNGGCRVMAFNTLRQDLVVSQPSGNTVFAGFGVRVVNSVDWQPSRFVLLHTKAVRDLQFHSEDRDLLLSVSLDQNAKLFDLAANTTVHTFKGEGPLWSCCWDMSHPHLLLLGSQQGKVFQYDRRMTDHYVNLWETENNKTPVVALASAPCRANTAFPQGGFLACRLNTVYSYMRQGEKYNCKELNVEGPFMSMRYDGATQMMLTTSRPSSRSPHTRVCLSLLHSVNSGQVPLIHTFNCGSSARVMSRSIALPQVDDSLVVAHNESGRTLDMWSSRSGNRLYSVPVREPIIDLTSVPVFNNRPPLLAALSEKKLTLYRINK